MRADAAPVPMPVRRPGLACGLLLLAVLGAGPGAAAARERLLIRGLQDLEVHDTDAGSRLLSLNDGERAAAGRLRLWVAGQLAPGLQAVGLGRLEGGAATGADGVDGALEQAFLRYAPPGRGRLVVDAGKLVAPFGNFSTRYLSDVNPLIGAPDGYPVAYPSGAVITGRFGWLDCRVAFLDRPLANESYLPPPDRAWRPGLGIGVTPMVGLRVAAWSTRGPYLGRGVAPALPAGAAWKDFDQQLHGMELAFSRGHLELNADLAFSRYEVPTRPVDSKGVAWFVEPRYNWTPRLFTALRVQYNDYPFIRPLPGGSWIAANAAFVDLEIGAGWRFTRNLLLKAAYRRDRWNVEPEREAMFPNGHAFAVQLSYAFDVISWLDRPR